MKEDPKYKLPADVANEFEIIGDQVRAHFPGFGLIDLRTVSLAQAKDLVSKGFPYLKEKTKKKTKE